MAREESIKQLCTQMLEALEVFDTSILPHGLYAAGDLAVPEKPQNKPPRRHHLNVKQHHQEWFAGLKPFIESNGGNILSEPRYSYGMSDLPLFKFQLPDAKKIQLTIAKISKIKVRQYGSKYHVDKHESFDERWKELKLDSAISGLRSRGGQNWEDVKLLLFIGFDKSQRPFNREFSELKPHNKREEHNITFEMREWPDKAGRGFTIRAALWANSGVLLTDVD